MQINQETPEKATADKISKTPSRKKGMVFVRAGQPLSFEDTPDTDIPEPGADSGFKTIGATFRTYRDAVQKLLQSKYAGQRELAPVHMRELCDIFIVRCSDAIFVRYDVSSGKEPRLRYAEVPTSVAEIAPMFSEQMIHFPDNPETYAPPLNGPEIIMSNVNNNTAERNEVGRFRLLLYVKKQFPDEFQIPAPPARPPCFAAVQNEFDLQMRGIIEPINEPEKSVKTATEEFIAHSRFKFPVGWQAIEIYSPLGDEYWKPEYAQAWAELDLLAAIAQKNLISSNLKQLDGRGAARKEAAALLQRLEDLLTGPEEPLHQFLKNNPQLLCPTAPHYWSKLSFGDRKSDFVFCEPYNDYLLVEIEAPSRKLFRKDGQQHAELTHAIDQIRDWIRYIEDNKQKVESGNFQ